MAERRRWRGRWGAAADAHGALPLARHSPPAVRPGFERATSGTSPRPGVGTTGMCDLLLTETLFGMWLCRCFISPTHEDPWNLFKPGSQPVGRCCPGRHSRAAGARTKATSFLVTPSGPAVATCENSTQTALWLRGHGEVQEPSGSELAPGFRQGAASTELGVSACTPGLLSACFSSDEHWGAQVTPTRVNEPVRPPGKQCDLGRWGVEDTPATAVKGGNVTGRRQVFCFQMN